MEAGEADLRHRSIAEEICTRNAEKIFTAGGV